MMPQPRTARTLTIAALAALTAAATLALVPGGAAAQTSAQSAFAVERVSLGPGGADADGASRGAAVSADGSVVAFSSFAKNLVEPTLTGGIGHVYARVGAANEMVSVATDETPASSTSLDPDVNDDGRFVSFSSFADDLAPGDGNGMADVFVRDRFLGVTTRIGAVHPQASSQTGSLSGDGMRVAFSSLRADQPDLPSAVYLADLGSQTTIPVATDPAVPATNPEVSGDGEHVAYIAQVGSVPVVRVYDVVTGQTSDVPPLSGFWPTNVSISRDGQVLAFVADRADGSGTGRAFVRDRVAGATTPIDPANTTDGDVQHVAVSPDGGAAGLTVAHPNGRTQIWHVDLVTGVITIVSASRDGSPAAGFSSTADVSEDGDAIAFTSTAADLVADDTNGMPDAFVARAAHGPAWPDGASLAATDVEATSLTLEWPAADADGGIAAYELFIDGTPLAEVDGEDTSHGVTGLDPGRTYQFSVGAVDTAGAKGVLLHRSVTTDADATLAATARPGGLVDLAWEAAAGGGIDGYDIWRAKGDGPLARHAQVGAGTTDHRDTGLPASTTFRYEVRLRLTGGGTRPHTVEATATTPHLTIDDVTATTAVAGTPPLASPGEDVEITLVGEPNRTASAAVALLDPDPSTEQVDLAEDADEPGTYRGELALVEGITEVTSVTGRLTDGAGHEATAAAAGFPQAVGGALVVVIAGPSNSLPGAHVLITSESMGIDESLSVNGGGEYTLAPIPPAVDYAVSLVDGSGTAGARRQDVSVESGRTTTVSLPSDLPASIEVLVQAGGQPIVGAFVDLRRSDGRIIDVGMSDRAGLARFSNPALRAGRAVTLDVRVGQRPFLEPALLDLSLQSGVNPVVFDLEPMQEGAIEGQVFTASGPAPGAWITVTQSVDGRQWSFQTLADDHGRYRVNAAPGPARVTFSWRYFPPVRADVVVPPGGSVVADGDLRLIDYEVHVILLTRSIGSTEWRHHVISQPGVASFFRLELRTPATVRMTSERQGVALAEGARIEICADGRNLGLPASCVSVVAGAERIIEAELRLGSIAAVTATLLDEQGAPLAASDAWTGSMWPVDPAGDPTGEPVLARGTGPDLRLGVRTAGDYELRVVGIHRGVSRSSAVVGFSVGDGDIADLGPLHLSAGSADPALRRIAERSEVVVVRPRVLPGGVTEVRTTYRADVALADAVAMLEIPAGTELVTGSVVLDGQPVDATVQNGFVEVPVGDIDPAVATEGVVRHQLRLRSVRPGTAFSVVSFLRFGGAAGLTTVILGQDRVLALGVTLEGPAITDSRTVVLTGRAPAGEVVTVHDRRLVVGETVATPGGFWRLSTELPDWGIGPEHVLWAEVANEVEVLRSRDHFLTVDDRYPRLRRITMLQEGGNRVDIDPAFGIAQFPFVSNPSKPFKVEAVFDRPELVRSVTARIGTRSVPALPGSDGVWRATMTLGMNEFGPLRVFFEAVPERLVVPARIPTIDEVRDRLPAAFADFVPGSGGTAAGAKAGGTGTVTAALPSLGPTGSATVSLTMTPDVPYQPSASDLALVDSTGIPAYGFDWTSQVGADSVRVSISAFIPEESLRGGSDAAKLLLRAALTQARSSAGPRVPTVGTKAVSSFVKVGAEVTIKGYDLFDDSKSPIDFNDDLRRLQDLADDAYACGPGAEYLRDQADKLLRDILIAQGTKATLMVAGVLLAPETFGFGTIAVFAASELIEEAFDRAIDRRLKKLKQAIDTDSRCDPDDDGDDGDDSDEDGDGDGGGGGGSGAGGGGGGDPTWLHDPSGFVYEAVPSNRLEDVTATLLYAPTPDGPWSVWDADWFGQLNPQVTDPAGRYGWDVPEGWWQVLYTKDGYLPGESEVLEVLPPHFDVNAGLVSLAPPTVASIDAFTASGGDPSAVEVVFDRHLDLESVSADSITVTDPGGDEVIGNLSPLDEESSLARRFRFVPTEPFALGEVLTVHVDPAVESYAGTPLGDAVEREVTVGQRPAPPDPAPTLVLPEQIEAVTVQPAGTIVRFIATATDNQPTSPAVTCSPASGSRFPLGTTAVRCSATDAAGNTSEGMFPVTVDHLTGRGGLRLVIDRLAELQLTGKPGKALKKARDTLAKADADVLWDDEGGPEEQRTFDRLREAVTALGDVRHQTTGEAMADLSALVADAAHDAVDDAAAVVPAKKLKVARTALADGDRSLSRGAHADAIKHFKKAWHHATKLLEAAHR